ncbi:MAG: tetratricopeptide repeat protein [Pirellulaceae bacterium]
MIRILVLSLTTCGFCCCRLGFAQEEWIGRRVYYKVDAVARVDDRMVESDGLFDFPETVEVEDGDWVSLGQGWMLKRDLMNADEAFEYYDELVRTNPSAVFAWEGRASSATDRGDFERAIADFTYAIQLKPKSAPLYTNRAIAKNSSKDFNGAVRDCDVAATLDPQYASAYWARGFAYFSLGKAKEALADYDIAIGLNPTVAKLYADRGSLRYFEGDLEGAIKDSSEAIRIDPKCMMALYSLAWIHATASDSPKRDGKSAVKLATKACELTNFQDPNTLGTLAAAYAETGDFATAIRYLKQANDIDPNSSNEFRRKMLLSFQAQEPFRN